MALAPVDWIVLLLYACVVVTVGLRAASHAASSEGYFLAGRQLRWPFIGASLFASNISAEHFVGLAGSGFAIGLAVGGFEWMAVYCLVPLILLFLPFYIRNRIYTVPEFLEQRFSPGVRTLFSALMIVLSVLTKITHSHWASSIVYSEVLGWDRHAVLWIVGAVTALYTMKGGLRAVVYTDAIQTAILLVAAAILTFTGLSRVGGWDALHARLPSEMFSTIAPATHPDVPWPGMFIGVFLIGSFYWCMDQVLVQRVFAARDLNEGRLGAIFCAFLKLSTPFLLVLPGLIAKALFPDLTVADRAYPLLLTTLLPHGLLGLTVAGIAAALMGHLSATYNSVATLVTRDFYLKWRPAAAQPAQVKAGRITVAVVFLLGALWAPIIGGFPSLWIYLQSVGAYLMMPFVAVFYFGVLWRRATTAGVYASAITGFIAGPALMIDNRLHVIRALDTPLLRPWLHTAIIEFLLCALALVFVSLVTAPVSKEKLAATTIGRFTDHAPRGLAGYRLWLAAVLALVTLLWFWTR